MTLLRLLWLLATLLFETATDEDDTPDDDGDDDEPEEIRDPLRKLAAREEQVKRLAKKLDKKDAEIKRLTEAVPDTDMLTSLQLENSYLRCVISRGESLDTGTAWDLLHARGFADAVTVKDDGTVDDESMSAALDKLLNRYPWLHDLDNLDDEPDEPSKPSGRPMHSRKNGGKQADNASLAGRFPALRGKVPLP